MYIAFMYFKSFKRVFLFCFIFSLESFGLTSLQRSYLENERLEQKQFIGAANAFILSNFHKQ